LASTGLLDFYRLHSIDQPGQPLKMLPSHSPK
jgi:hypothetical protein